MEAIQKGYHAILCTHPLQLELPVQLLLPERKQAYILQGSLFGEQFPESSPCSLQDCYPEHALQAQMVQMQLKNNMKAYTGMLRVAQGVRTVMQQYYQVAEKPIQIQKQLAQLLCAFHQAEMNHSSC